MANFVLLVLCFLMGIFLRKSGRFPATSPTALNGFIIYLSLPAIALLHIHSIKVDATLIYPALMAWLLFGIGVVFFRFIGRLAGFSRGTVGALMLAGGLGNTSFVGLPMIETWYGKDFLGVGVIADQLGSFLVLSTLGLLTAVLCSSGEVTRREMARKVLMFPPFQALVVALLLRPVPYPAWLVEVLQKLGNTLTPLALVSVGFQLRLDGVKSSLKPLTLGLLYKLVLGPAFIALLYVGLMGASGDVIRVTIFEAAMAPMITAGIIAVDHDLDPPLVTLLLGIGIPLSFLTLPGWWWLMGRF